MFIFIIAYIVINHRNKFYEIADCFSSITITILSASLETYWTQEQLDNIPSGWKIDATAAYSTDCENYLGIDDELLAKNLNIYPNPVSDILTVDSKLPLSKIEIYSILGQRVKEINSDFNSISTNYLSRGIYMIKIYSEKGTTVKKLIKK